MLEIKDLHATAGDKPVLQGLSLTVKAGEVHAIMGPNGSGKSTLAHVLSGRDGFAVTKGSVLYKGRDLLAGALLKHRGLPELDAADFLKVIKEKAKLLELGEGLLNRPVNEGFSGGEKKRNEILQMTVLEPTLAVLDETDSGLDIDALRIVGRGITSLRSKDRAFIVITHFPRILEHVIPDRVHVLKDGRIAKSGGKELALELEATGYAGVKT